MERVIQEKLSNFFANYPQVHFKNGDMVIGSSDTMEYIYYLQEGYVTQRYITPEGEELILHIFKPVSFFPMMIALSKQENDFDFIAMDSLVLYKAPVEDVITFVKENPDVLYDLSVRFAQGINGLIKRVISLSFVDSQAKLASILCYFADNIGVTNEEGIKIPFYLTHTNLSSWLGVARETVSRYFEIFEKEELLEYNDHKIIIRNIDGLRKKVSKETRENP